MEKLVNNTKRADQTVLLTLLMSMLITVISSIAMVKSAHASGTVASGKFLSAGNCIKIRFADQNFDPFLNCVIADKGAATAWVNLIGECGGCDVYVTFPVDSQGQCPASTGCFGAYHITLTYGCPDHAILSGSTCTCIDPYVPDITRTSCIMDQYTLSLKTHPLEKIEPSGSASVIATVTDAQGNGVSGASVRIKVDVDANSGGHDHGESMAPRDKGSMSGDAACDPPDQSSHCAIANTGTEGNASFTFKATPVSGKHTFTATCLNAACSSSAAAEIKVMVDGLEPIPSDPTLYVFIGGDADKQHHDNHYLTNEALSQLYVLAINYHFRYPNEPLLHLNDASLVWGGKFDIKGNWVGNHKAHKRGTVIDIRANKINEKTNINPGSSIPESLFADFEKLAVKAKTVQSGRSISAQAQLHCSQGFDPATNCIGDSNRHYHVILLGVDQ